MKLKEYVELDKRLQETKKERLNYYKDLMHTLGEKDMKNIDEYALRKTCWKYNYPTERLKEDIAEWDEKEEEILEESKETLTEDQTLDSSIKQATEKVEQVNDSVIIKSLNRALEFNEKRKGRGWTSDFQNVMFIGPPGAGKTSITKEWARQNNINLVVVKAQTLTPEDMGGVMVPDMSKGIAKPVKSTLLDSLEEPRSVLFLDEFNRAGRQVRDPLLELINSHELPDLTSKTGLRKFNNLLFTVAAINNESFANDTETLNAPELSRFRRIYVIGSPEETLEWLNNQLQRDLSMAKDPQDVLQIQGQIELAKTILTAKDFVFDDDDKSNAAFAKFEASVSPRTFTAAILNCDGTKEDLLKIWPEFVNSASKPLIARILEKYVDVEDRANDALKKGTKSKIFKNEKSLMDKLRDHVQETDGIFED